MFGLDALASIVGLVFPPVADFIKKKFIKPSADTPQATLSSLATTKPEIMPQYIESQSKLIDSEVRFFNRDVVQQVSTWVSDLRASIRPIFTVISLALVIYSTIKQVPIDESFKCLMDLCISSWFGSRLVN